MNHYKALICTYNPNDYFIEQLDTIINNGISDILISDDSDSNENNASKLLDQLKFDNAVNVKIFDGIKQGNASANFLHAICSLDNNIDWVFLSDQDDLWFSNKVDTYKELISQLNAYGEPIAICSDATVVDQHENIISDSLQFMINRKKEILLTDDILFNNCVQGATLCLNNSMIKEIKRLKGVLDFNRLESLFMYDWFIAILAKYNGKCLYLDIPTMYYRIHGANEVGAKKARVRYLNYILSPQKTINKLLLVNKRYKFITDFLSKEGFMIKNNLTFSCYSSKIKSIFCKILV